VIGGTVVVRGHAAVPAEPDQLQVTLTVSAVMGTADGALAEAGRLNAELGRVLDELAIGACDRSQSGLMVREEFERVEGRWARRGYRAANVVAVRMTDPTHVGRLLREAVDRAGVQVDGPRWRCRPEHPARVEACRQAAVDARRKAAAYAAALGLRLGAVLRVDEPGADNAGGTRPAPAPTDMRTQAGHLDVESTVEVTFALEPCEG
jgi:uncharacterized protein YggE